MLTCEVKQQSDIPANYIFSIGVYLVSVIVISYYAKVNLLTIVHFRFIMGILR